MKEKLNKAILKYFNFRKKYISLGINSWEKKISPKKLGLGVDVLA